MRALYQKILYRSGQSFLAIEGTMDRFNTPWHFHPEIELTYIVSSRGRRFVGNNLESFKEGDLVLLGPELPHYWENAGSQLPGTRASVIVIQFHRDFLGEAIWRNPEFSTINRLLERAGRGLSFSTETARRMEPQIRVLPRLKGLCALTALLKLLYDLAQEPTARSLTLEGFVPVLDRRSAHRMSRVIAYLGEHLTEPLTLQEMAKVAAMTPSAFSRYFKGITKKCPTVFLNDLRIELAARYLRETTRTVTDISGTVGFTSLTSFNRRFKERMRATPREYRRAFLL